jgi:transaldolase
VKLFIDTGSVDEVSEIAAWGILSGATTNPSLLAKEDADPGESLKAICSLVQGPVSGEVVSDDAEGMIREGRAIAGIDQHMIVKLPFSAAGLEACSTLREDGIRINMTLVFSPAQAILTAEAGATYISCFMGRLDDISVDSIQVVEGIVSAVRNTDAKVLAASLRHPQHVVLAAQLGCDVATVPGKVLRQMLLHPLTESGIATFTKDWDSKPELAAWMNKLVG